MFDRGVPPVDSRTYVVPSDATARSAMVPLMESGVVEGG
jgi:hypothetical protein